MLLQRKRPLNLGNGFGIVSFLSFVDPAYLFGASGFLVFVVAVVIYFRSLHRPAQDAALYALPRRRFLENTRLGQYFLKLLAQAGLTNERSYEDQHGYIDLDRFAADEIDKNPVIQRIFWARGAKRLGDIMISFAMIIFMLPILVITAGLIKLDSPGPVFYRQIRVGRNGRPFRIFKFRSMRVDAEQNGAQWAGEGDARITAVGQFIRKSRIDEIPQTLNILLGDMSFVGPRPERPEFTHILGQKIPHYDLRHQVKPGLTGWAQVSYPYGASIEDSREKLKYDLYYLKNYSLVLDLFIVIKTVRVALLGLGSR